LQKNIHKIFPRGKKRQSFIYTNYLICCRSQWPRGLRRRYAAARLLRLWVRIPQGAWMFFCCECCVLLDTDLCDELIALPEKSYRLWCVVVCDLIALWMRRPWSTGGLSHQRKKKINLLIKEISGSSAASNFALLFCPAFTPRIHPISHCRISPAVQQTFSLVLDMRTVYTVQHWHTHLMFFYVFLMFFWPCIIV